MKKLFLNILLLFGLSVILYADPFTRTTDFEWREGTGTFRIGNDVRIWASTSNINTTYFIQEGTMTAYQIKFWDGGTIHFENNKMQLNPGININGNANIAGIITASTGNFTTIIGTAPFALDSNLLNGTSLYLLLSGSQVITGQPIFINIILGTATFSLNSDLLDGLDSKAFISSTVTVPSDHRQLISTGTLTHSQMESQLDNIAASTTTLQNNIDAIVSTTNTWTATQNFVDIKSSTGTFNLIISTDLIVDGNAEIGNTLNVDSVNKRVGVGTSTPTVTLDVQGTIKALGLNISTDNLITVDNKGGHEFTSIVAAHNSITDASEDNEYAMLVYGGAPYYENVIGKSFVHPKGVGFESVVVKGSTGTLFTYPAGKCYVENISFEGYPTTSGMKLLEGIQGGEYVYRKGKLSMIHLSSGITGTIAEWDCIDWEMSDFDLNYIPFGSSATKLEHNLVISSNVSNGVMYLGNTTTLQGDTNDDFNVIDDRSSGSGFYAISSIALAVSTPTYTGTMRACKLTGGGTNKFVKAGIINILNLSGVPGGVGTGCLLDSPNNDGIVNSGNTDYIVQGFNKNYAFSVGEGDTFNSGGDIIRAVDGNISSGTINMSSLFNGEQRNTEGIFIRPSKYGTGLWVNNFDEKAPILYGNADGTFTAATQELFIPGADFAGEGVVSGNFAIIRDASIANYIKGYGEILIVSGSTLTISAATFGSDTLVDVTDINVEIFPHPIAVIGDNGDIHFSIGKNKDAKFHISNTEANNDQTIVIEDNANKGNHSAMCFEINGSTFSSISAININFDATEYNEVSNISNNMIMSVNNVGATSGTVRGIEFSVTDEANSNLSFPAISTRPQVDVVKQTLGTPISLGAGFQKISGVFVDSTTAFNSAANNVPIFENQNDEIIICATAKFDQIGIILTNPNSPGMKNADLEFYYSTGTSIGDWQLFSPADGTNGIQQNGSISYNSDNLVGWSTMTVTTITDSDITSGTTYYPIKIKRTATNLNVIPIEQIITVTTLGAEYIWDKNGNVSINKLSLTNGVPEPDPEPGVVQIWIDDGDNDGYVKYPDGTKVKWLDKP